MQLLNRTWTGQRLMRIASSSQGWSSLARWRSLSPAYHYSGLLSYLLLGQGTARSPCQGVPSANKLPCRLPPSLPTRKCPGSPQRRQRRCWRRLPRRTASWGRCAAAPQTARGPPQCPCSSLCSGRPQRRQAGSGGGPAHAWARAKAASRASAVQVQARQPRCQAPHPCRAHLWNL